MELVGSETDVGSGTSAGRVQKGANQENSTGPPRITTPAAAIRANSFSNGRGSGISEGNWGFRWDTADFI